MRHNFMYLKSVEHRCKSGEQCFSFQLTKTARPTVTLRMFEHLMERIIKKAVLSSTSDTMVENQCGWSSPGLLPRVHRVGGDLTFPFPDWTEPGVSTPLTHDHPSFLSSSFRPKLRYTPRYPSINTKETLQRLLFGESMFPLAVEQFSNVAY